MSNGLVELTPIFVTFTLAVSGRSAFEKTG